jgi:hypothetical protein
MARKLYIEFGESMQQVLNISTFNAGQFYASKFQVYASQKRTVWYSNEENFAAFAGREAVSYGFSIEYAG